VFAPVYSLTNREVFTKSRNSERSGVIPQAYQLQHFKRTTARHIVCVRACGISLFYSVTKIGNMDAQNIRRFVQYISAH
jgi:hypothetical protein